MQLAGIYGHARRHSAIAGHHSRRRRLLVWTADGRPRHARADAGMVAMMAVTGAAGFPSCRHGWWRRCRRALGDIRLIETLGRRCGLAGMEVSRDRSVERSRCAGPLTACRLGFVAWLSNDVPACRGLERLSIVACEPSQRPPILDGVIAELATAQAASLRRMVHALSCPLLLRLQ
jgi:hypothetical protein